MAAPEDERRPDQLRGETDAGGGTVQSPGEALAESGAAPRLDGDAAGTDVVVQPPDEREIPDGMAVSEQAGAMEAPD